MRRQLLALGASLLLLGGALAPAAADTGDDKAKVDAALADAGDDLADANGAVKQAITDLKQAREELPTARKELATAREAVRQARTVDAASQDELEQANAAAIRAEQERATVEFEIKDLQSKVGNLARQVYQNGAFAEFDLLITADSPNELSDRAAALDAVSRANNKTLAQMAEIRADLALKEARLEALRAQVEQKRQLAAIALKRASIAQSQAAAAKAKVDALVAKKATALDVAATERAKVLKQYKAYQAEQKRISTLMAKEAARQAAALTAGQSTAQSYVATAEDGFVWPVEGSALRQEVGPRIHPVYGYRSCHTGIDLGGSTGTPIKATAAGTVVSVATGGPYGYHTLLSHGDGIFSMYAHQSRFGVTEGQTVNAGDVIGFVGTTGWVTGPHLHFEIHVGSQPYDPMGWFGGSKTPVSCS